MTFPLIMNALIAVFLVFGVLNGLRRGGVKEGAALSGVLLGALLAELLARRWGSAISPRFIGDTNTATWLVALGLLFGTAILTGYGGSALLRRGPIKGSERAAGALLGLLNTLLLTVFGLRYTQQFYFLDFDPNQPVESWIRSGPLSRYLLQYFDLALVGLAGLVALAALIAFTVRLGRRLSRPAPAKPATTPASGGSTTRPAATGTTVTSAPTTSTTTTTPSWLNGPDQPKTNTPPSDLPPGKRESFIE